MCTGCYIPNEIEYNERILRTIFSPINLSKDGSHLVSNAFISPKGMDEVSVNRLDYTSIEFCKFLGHRIQQPQNRRNYFGFALLYNGKIVENECYVKYQPEIDNAFHANIKTGFVCLKGEVLPLRIKQKVDHLTSAAKLFKDPDPLSKMWNGYEIK